MAEALNEDGKLLPIDNISFIGTNLNGLTYYHVKSG